MDQRLTQTPGVWLAVTSISFDISGLEMFWTLTRGFKVIHAKRKRVAGTSSKCPQSRNASPKPLDFSLFYFARTNPVPTRKKYKLLLEGRRIRRRPTASRRSGRPNAFPRFWWPVPKSVGHQRCRRGITNRIQIRAGSVVLPLHNPIRVAEEWAIVDNLSNGRVAISFASGWQINDFVLAPDNYSRRKHIMLEQIELVRKLWRGETVSSEIPMGRTCRLRILPRPIQRELPIWITASGPPDTFKLAGELGANVLTHLLGQSVPELADKLAIYRAARKEHGHAGPGHVTLMLHTFVGEDDQAVREIVRAPFTAYLRSSIDLIKNDPWAFGTFKRAANGSNEPANPRISPTKNSTRCPGMRSDAISKPAACSVRSAMPRDD